MYVEVDTDLPQHPKSLRLASLLNEPRAWTRMVSLWIWAMSYALDGDLSKFSDQEVAQAMGYSLINETEIKSGLKNILKRSGFLDENEMIHDWKDRAKRLKKKRVAMRKLRSKRGQHVTSMLPPRGSLLPLRGEERRGKERKGSEHPPNPPGGRPKKPDHTFADFWNMWPYKTAKAQAERTWNKLAKKGKLPSLSTLGEAIAWQSRAGCLVPGRTKEGRDTRPHPSTWLNGERWNDEPDAPPGEAARDRQIQECPKCGDLTTLPCARCEP